MLTSNQKEQIANNSLKQIPQSQKTLFEQKLKINTQNPYTTHFKIQANTITFIQPFSSYYTQLLIDTDIPKKSKFSYKLRIKESPSSSIFLGITNKHEYQTMRSSHNLKNSFSYFGKKYLVWPGGQEQGKGFGQSDTVEVRVDGKNQEIVWVVNGITQAKKRSTLLASMDFVPFIEMNQQGDVVEWLGSWVQ